MKKIIKDLRMKKSFFVVSKTRTSKIAEETFYKKYPPLIAGDKHFLKSKRLFLIFFFRAFVVDDLHVFGGDQFHAVLLRPIYATFENKRQKYAGYVQDRV